MDELVLILNYRKRKKERKRERKREKRKKNRYPKKRKGINHHLKRLNWEKNKEMKTEIAFSSLT